VAKAATAGRTLLIAFDSSRLAPLAASPRLFVIQAGSVVSRRALAAPTFLGLDLDWIVHYGLEGNVDGMWL